jgi:hypothetical protein
MPVTIPGRQRDAIYEVVIHHVTAIGDVANLPARPPRRLGSGRCIASGGGPTSCRSRALNGTYYGQSKTVPNPIKPTLLAGAAESPQAGLRLATMVQFRDAYRVGKRLCLAARSSPRRMRPT